MSDEQPSKLRRISEIPRTNPKKTVPMFRPPSDLEEDDQAADDSVS